MAKKKQSQKRVGKNEALVFGKAVKALRNYKIFQIHKTKKETFFNHLVFTHLLQ